MKNLSVMVLAGLIAVSGCSNEPPYTPKNATLTPQEAKQIAKDAYVYGFPLVLNYKTMYEYAVNKESSEYKGDFNQIGCVARLFTPEDKAIITPNSDTPYCMAWVDLRAEPVVFTIPEIEKERYYSVQLIDLYTHNAGYISSVQKDGPGNYLLTGPNWEGEVPEGITKIIPFETSFIFSIHRTQLFNAGDINKLKKIQDGYTIKPLSTFLGTDAPEIAQAIDAPVWENGTEFTAQSFKYLDFMLTLVKTPEAEQDQMKRFARIGLGDDDKFNIEEFGPDIQKALEEGVQEGLTAIKEFAVKASADPLASTKVFGTRAFLNRSAKENYNLNQFFILRATAAQSGIYGNSGAEATYPSYLADSEGNPFNASINDYTLTFNKGELPPVNAFWSLTMYDGKTQLLIDNPLNRYLLNSPMMEDFVMNKDGSLTIYVQKDSPGKELEANWLPAPDGPFYTIMRLYGPKKEALEGDWIAPPLVKK
ncbi:DUF1254 domain-containing protein [Alkalimarinus sediminis]|uniref:DUF1254 domain-containing protein n=1 Tax=Alkalimarinus sediminis TaxID=1632866 RepID=A0A9E8HV11_9ALTE|nr:DUF1254 domain-containing protein [Alkalimarinus sediminis]UZW76244.1 DUF1254 domain-containing protein [Alkalimarinus sediminis]